MIPTQEQQAAINYTGDMIVIAKPGSGKTFVISEKIRNILLDSPDYRGVIAISYTNKASAELKTRISRDGLDIKNSCITTIDKFCISEIILPFYTHIFGFKAQELLVCKINDLSDKEKANIKPRQHVNFILDDLSCNLDVILDFLKSGRVFIETIGALSLYILSKSSACHRYIKARYSHIFIDEYQDAGREQHELFLFLRELGLTAIAVGDCDQSIFAFSGKSADYLLSLANVGFQNFAINYNHRCHDSIVNYANVFLAKNTIPITCDEIRVYELEIKGDYTQAAAWIDKHLTAIKKHFEVDSNSKVGVLARNKKTAQLINDFMKTGHRFIDNHPLEDSQSLFAQFLCLLLRYRYNKNITAEEILDQKNIISEGLSRREQRKLLKQIETVNINDLPQLVRDVFLNITSLSVIENDLQKIEGNDDAFLRKYFSDPDAEEIQIMTIHKSKGLEFDIIFHLDLIEWGFPSKTPGKDAQGRADFNNCIYSNLAQDKNLHYVAVTRARKACYLCSSTIRYNSSGKSMRGKPSDFLQITELTPYKKKINCS